MIIVSFFIQGIISIFEVYYIEDFILNIYGISQDLFGSFNVFVIVLNNGGGFGW